GFPGLVHFVISPWSPSFQTIHPGIRPHISPIHISLFRIYRNPVRVSMPHGKYFGPGLRSALGKQIPFRGTITAVPIYLYTQILRAEVIGSPGGSTGIVLFLSRAVV